MKKNKTVKALTRKHLGRCRY